MLKDTEGISKILPQTVERLKALEGLHNKGICTFNKIILNLLPHIHTYLKLFFEYYVNKISFLANDFARTLTQVEALQSVIQGSIRNNKDLLQGVQECFAINLEGINKSVESMDAKIKALSSKIK